MDMIANGKKPLDLFNIESNTAYTYKCMMHNQMHIKSYRHNYGPGFTIFVDHISL